MYISPGRAASGNPVVPEGNVRFRGPLSVVFKTPEMHISPWYWFSTTVALELTRLFRLKIMSNFVSGKDTARSWALRFSRLTHASGNHLQLKY